MLIENEGSVCMKIEALPGEALSWLICLINDYSWSDFTFPLLMKSPTPCSKVSQKVRGSNRQKFVILSQIIFPFFKIEWNSNPWYSIYKVHTSFKINKGNLNKLISPVINHRLFCYWWFLSVLFPLAPQLQGYILPLSWDLIC